MSIRYATTTDLQVTAHIACDGGHLYDLPVWDPEVEFRPDGPYLRHGALSSAADFCQVCDAPARVVTMTIDGPTS